MAGRSDLEPASVRSTCRILPPSMLSKAFFVFKTGIGQFRPLRSAISSGVMVISAIVILLLHVKFILCFCFVSLLDKQVYVSIKSKIEVVGCTANFYPFDQVSLC